MKVISFTSSGALAKWADDGNLPIAQVVQIVVHDGRWYLFYYAAP